MTPVVLVHGVGLDRHMWNPFIEALGCMAPRRPVVVYDMIGLGEGPHPPGPYSLAQYATQLDDVAQHEAVDVVGFSMGALVAQRFAIDFPTRVHRLVLVSAVFDRDPAERSAIAARVAGVRDGGYAASIEPALQRWFTPSFARSCPTVIDAVRDRLRSNDVDAYASAYEVFATGDQDLAAHVGGITAPTLVITGGCDERSTPSMAERLAAVMPDATCVIVPALRHLIPLEAPAELAALVSSFLDRTEASHV